MDLLEALLLCLAVIVIQNRNYRGNNRITDSCQIRNDPRKENRNSSSSSSSSAVYDIFRFSFSGIRANYETMNQIALLLLYVLI